MNLTEAQRLAKQLIREFGIDQQGWRFSWDNAKRRHGQTRFGIKTISLSRPLTQLNEASIVENTIRHEIAHVLAGPNHGHDAMWRAHARRCGAKPETCCSEGESVPPAIVGTCANPECDIEHPRHRAPQRGRNYFCASPACVALPLEDKLITWRRVR